MSVDIYSSSFFAQLYRDYSSEYTHLFEKVKENNFVCDAITAANINTFINRFRVYFEDNQICVTDYVMEISENEQDAKAVESRNTGRLLRLYGICSLLNQRSQRKLSSMR